MKEQSKLKLSSSKLRIMPLVECCDESSTSGAEPQHELDFDPARHVQTPFKPGSNLKSADNGLFTCTKNTDLIKTSQKVIYSDLTALHASLI